MTVETLIQESSAQQIHRRFLYADYSLFDDNSNVIEMLKEFVSVTSALLRLNLDNERMASLMTAADSLTKDVKAVLDQQRTFTADAIDSFYKKYPDPLATEIHTSSVALVNDAKKNILALLANTKAGLDEQHRRYDDNLISRININHTNAATLLEKWLSIDYMNLPTLLLSRLSVEVMIHIDPTSPKTYSIHRGCKIIDQKAKGTNQNVKDLSIFPVNYAFQVDTSELVFWCSIRKISEFGLKDVELPIGMKAPLTEKLKNAFKLGNKKNDIVMQPEFAKIDDYCLLSITLNEKTLVVQVVPDIAKTDNDLIEIIYHLPELQTWGHAQPNNELPQATNHPKINYKSTNNGQPVEFMDLLAVKQIAHAADLTKIMNLGTSILEKLKMLEDPKILSSRSKLQLLNVSGKNILIHDGVTIVEFTPLFELLNLIAIFFAPIVRRLKEKTPVQGELILREQMENGQRAEFVVKLEYLRSQLSSCPPLGQTISDNLHL